LHAIHAPRCNRGFTIFFTGLSGAGKSTIAAALRAMLDGKCGQPVTLLDGDAVRKNLSSDLGFSKQDRDTNIRRIGFVAREATMRGGIAICAQIAPYDAARKAARRMLEEAGGFVLVHVATPLDVCEKRDPKGLYAKARAGLIPSFTGISDPYEPPPDAEVVVDTTDVSVEEAAEEIVRCLVLLGYLRTGNNIGAADGQPSM
jgi:sulfate adenylyltransferase